MRVGSVFWLGLIVGAMRRSGSSAIGFSFAHCFSGSKRLSVLGSAAVARDDLIQATGQVEKVLGGGRYQIGLDSGQTITAQLSGRMRRFRIRVIPGDRVQVGVSPYDPTHGFITFRLREGEAPPS